MCLASIGIFLIIPLLTSKYFSPSLTLEVALFKKKLPDQKNNYDTIVRKLLDLITKRMKKKIKRMRKKKITKKRTKRKRK